MHVCMFAYLRMCTRLHPSTFIDKDARRGESAESKSAEDGQRRGVRRKVEQDNRQASVFVACQGKLDGDVCGECILSARDLCCSPARLFTLGEYVEADVRQTGQAAEPADEER